MHYRKCKPLYKSLTLFNTNVNKKGKLKFKCNSVSKYSSFSSCLNHWPYFAALVAYIYSVLSLHTHIYSKCECVCVYKILKNTANLDSAVCAKLMNPKISEDSNYTWSPKLV